MENDQFGFEQNYKGGNDYEYESDQESDDQEVIPQEDIKPFRIGITHGDVNSISYEVILKSLQDDRVFEYFTPVLYGSSKVASYHRKALNMGETAFHVIRSAGQAEDKKLNLVNVITQEVKVDLGQSTDVAGKAAYLALEAATLDLAEGRIDAMVTGPINKQNIQSKDFNFPGHTEYLAGKFQSRDYLMLMVSQSMRIGMITGHVPLRDVPSLISEELLLQKIRIMNNTLVRDFGIRKPRIAVLGLNPHAGDKGVLGVEEETIIIPAIQKACEQGMLAFGPYPADGFFGSSTFSNFDGILAMYHDQGLIPFKSMAFQAGVNFTAGLPVVRTSPAHGTAYELAGKNQASPESFREAIYLAMDVVRNRRLFDEINQNPLKISALEEDSDKDKDELKSLEDDSDQIIL
ncbi:MAG: 4-hydroxythreonine-4-phosphate dehydrogenase PdxA [Bacteroidetes bacterium]|nr:MAG: 4-hydroxythreonine-4-phosphate dehydrogenase PdxA [Bacteroidota bacterium]